MTSPLVRLLTSRRFAPLFVTQFLGAFNDNLLKSALAIIVTYRLTDATGISASALVMIAGGLFIAPFFLFSGVSGTLADRVDKSSIARIVKIARSASCRSAAGASGIRAFRRCWRRSSVLACTPPCSARSSTRCCHSILRTTSWWPGMP
jgi:hypothetical protein